MTTNILVIDDDPEIRLLLKTCFEREGYGVIEAADAKGARSIIERDSVGLITLDLTLGQEDGLRLAREIRSASDVPIVILSGKGDTVDRIVGLEIGADDYIAKPFSPREVLARVRAVLRRREGAPPSGGDANSHNHKVFTFSEWTLDVTSRELKYHGETQDLTTAEFNLLRIFIERPHRVLSRDEIMDLLKGHDYSPLDRSIDALVSRVRKKLKDTSDASCIKSIRGVGYMFASDVRRV